MRKNNQKDEQAQQRPEPTPNQLIPEKGEEYLREIANIEDTPSPAEDEEAERTMRDERSDEPLRP